jgi:hypothetical protein
MKEPNSPDLSRLLRLGGERRGKQAEDDEQSEPS